jgi:hypothetical protein
MVLDLHDAFNKGGITDAALNRVVDRAHGQKVALVESIPGNESLVISLLPGRREASQARASCRTAS